ncbi:Phenylacetaldehyde dehydrogenase [Pseudomonas fluorescens]|uniref:Phenylacetaldehyde dehydrogenase n=1 Tax=Pseudomonas fluorescens TaxID=294 RepID=A0A5E6TZE1_PSEFL|nr:aldehyde dehydrogenase family protein [Pseudomonas fluorescens]VVM98310.1 Phenylacetaldehyde dehydrogenase [Pseudomonas fluorescens]
MAIDSNDYSRLSPAARAFLERSHGHFIDGQWQSPTASIAVLDPSTGRQISAIGAGSAADIDGAVQAAHRAFNHSSWRGLAPLDRERLILRLAELIEANAALLSQVESVDNGMPLGFAEINVGGAAGVLRYMAGWPSKIVGDTVDVKMPFPGSQFFAYTAREAVGVVGAIVPWNVPLMMAIWKLAPALAAGCTVVLKPAEDASLTALILADLIQQAGIPNGVVNIVTGYGAEAGEALVRHPLVAKISFTGSTETGKYINRLATDSLKKVTLELGGKSPTIVFDDADLEQAIRGAANAIFTNAGQICVAGARLYVQRRVYEQVLEGVARQADSLQLGAGLNAGSQMGPLINARQLQRVQGYVQRAVQGGANLVTQGRSPQGDGFFAAPAVLADIKQGDDLVQQEVFGPVLAVLAFDDLEEAAMLANDTAYGLAASVWSRDLSRVHRLIPLLKCGKVSVNTEGFPYPALPEGGTKQSGFGRDLGREGLDGYLESKTVLVRVS